jgi:hypothetical protein
MSEWSNINSLKAEEYIKREPLKIKDTDGIKREPIMPPLIIEDIQMLGWLNVKSLSIKAEEGEPLKIEDIEGIKRS